jgi:hypothetical protein
MLSHGMPVWHFPQPYLGFRNSPIPLKKTEQSRIDLPSLAIAPAGHLLKQAPHLIQ